MNSNTLGEKFGEKLKVLRLSRDLTQKLLADFVGVNSRHISVIECGVKFPSKELFCQLTEVLKYEPKDFFDFDNLNPVEAKELNEINQKLKNNPHLITQINKTLDSMLS